MACTTVQHLCVHHGTGPWHCEGCTVIQYCSPHMCAPQYYLNPTVLQYYENLSTYNTIRIQCKCIENAGGQGREHRRLSTFALLPCLHFIWQTFSKTFCGFLTYSCYAVACTVPIGIFWATKVGIEAPYPNPRIRLSVCLSPKDPI